MCLIALQWLPAADPALVVVANRDEQHARETAALDYWPQAPHVLAGRDLVAGGTWMGLTSDGRFAALTNIREPQAAPGKCSRGHLVADFLLPPRARISPWDYAQHMAIRGVEFSGFNLLVGDANELVYLSNRYAQSPLRVPPGLHGLSNALLDTPWPKLQAAKQGLDLALRADADGEALFEIMQRRQAYADPELPDTGVGLPLERLLSPPFICSPLYGTRSTTVLRLGARQASISERRFDAAGQVTGQTDQQLSVADSASASG